MAGDWIKLEKATLTKPEVLRLASLLECTVGEAFYYCVRFWNWCDDHLTDGHASGVTSSMLDSLIGRAGFCEQLVVVGWLQVRSGSLEVPHFDRHLSESAKNRALSAKRKQKQRSGDVPEMSRSNRDISVTREEKRREEETSPNGDVGRSARKRFVPPSLSEVEAYCRERGNSVDAQRWLDHYSSNGWKVGRNPMKDWRAAVRNWEKSNVGKSGSSSVSDGIDDYFNAQGQPQTARAGLWPEHGG